VRREASERREREASERREGGSLVKENCNLPSGLKRYLTLDTTACVR